MDSLADTASYPRDSFWFNEQFSLALYCHAAKQTTTALRLLYRVRYLLLLITGPDHPEVANCDVSSFSSFLYLHVACVGLVA